MDEGQERPNNLIDTTDCLEAVGVFRGWKNVLFLVIFLSLLLLQLSFWAVDLGFVKVADDQAEAKVEVAPTVEVILVDQAAEKIAQAAKQIATEPNQAPAEAAPEPAPQEETAKPAGARFNLKIEHLSWAIRFLNFLIIPVAILYCLTMLFSLKISLLGRLGGINHISRAFFLSLLALVLLMPWQILFNGVVKGVLFMPQELIEEYNAIGGDDILNAGFYYLRFVVFALFEILLFLLAHFRSARWTRATLLRLEVI